MKHFTTKRKKSRALFAFVRSRFILCSKLHFAYCEPRPLRASLSLKQKTFFSRTLGVDKIVMAGMISVLRKMFAYKGSSN